MRRFTPAASVARITNPSTDSGAHRRIRNEQFCDSTYFARTAAKDVRKLEAERQQVAEKVERLMVEWERVEEELSALSPE